MPNLTDSQLTTPAKQGWLAGLNRNVYVLGAVSLFTDISSEMIVPIRFIFLVSVLNTPILLAGLIEGIAESTASLVKIISGQLSDRVASRKPLIVAGYSLSNLSKPLLTFANSWPVALGFIFLDRTGKGVRTSPRDALLADSVDAAHRGKAFGFHRAMDTLGAAIGPLLTVLILSNTGNNLNAVFLWTLLPGVLSIIVLLFFLREQSRMQTPKTSAKFGEGFKLSKLRELGTPFWLFMAISILFAVGNSSDAFIFLRTEGIENNLGAVPLVYFGYNVIYALLSTPLGALSDKFGRLPILLAGYLAFALVYFGWAFASQGWHTWGLFLIYGIYAAATEGVGKAFIADLIPKAQRGTAMGWFSGLVGLSALPANLLAGWLWTAFGASATFILGASLGLVAAGLLILWQKRLRPLKLQA